MNTPDREEIKTVHQYLKQQSQQPLQQTQKTIIDSEGHKKVSNPEPTSSSSSSVSVKNLQDPFKILNRNISTPESSQTDSDDVSPQIQRKRKTISHREILPKFSISVEEAHSE